MNFQMCLQRHTSAARGTSVLQPLKADRKYPHYWSVADYSYIHSIICSPTCLFVHPFTCSKIAAWFEWRVSCVFTEEMRVFCVGKLLWFDFTYGSQPKCWNLEPRWLSSCTWPDRALCACVFVTTPDDYSCFGRSSRGYRATSSLWSAYRHGNPAMAPLF